MFKFEVLEHFICFVNRSSEVAKVETTLTSRRNPVCKTFMKRHSGMGSSRRQSKTVSRKPTTKAKCSTKLIKISVNSLKTRKRQKLSCKNPVKKPGWKFDVADTVKREEMSTISSDIVDSTNIDYISDLMFVDEFIVPLAERVKLRRMSTGIASHF